jgi:hypothetical protein
LISKPETPYVRIAASSFRKLAKTFKFVPNISASFQRKKISRLRRASPDLLRLSRCWSCTTTCRNGQKKNCRRCTAAVRRAVGGPAAVRAPHHMPLLPGRKCYRKRTSRRARTAGLSRSAAAARSVCCSTGPARSATAAGRAAGSAAHSPLLPVYSFRTQKKNTVLSFFFFLMPVLCGAQSSSARQHHRTAVSACPQPCWCAAGSNKAAAAVVPLLFFARLLFWGFKIIHNAKRTMVAVDGW